MECFDFDDAGRATRRDLDSALPDTGWRWLHLDLTAKDTEMRLRELVPAAACDILLQPETRPRSLEVTGGRIVMLRGANFNPGQQADDMVALRIWLTPKLVITLRHRQIFAVRDLHDDLDNGLPLPGPGALLGAVLTSLVARIEAVSLGLDDRVDALEDLVQEREKLPHGALDDLPNMRRAAIRLIRYLRPQNVTLHDLQALQSPDLPGFDPSQIAECANRAQRALEELDSVHQRLTALADHQQSTKADTLARNGYGLSVIAAVFLPLGFVTGLFGMNVGGLPLTASPLGFALVCLGMGGAVAIVLLVLRWLRLI